MSVITVENAQREPTMEEILASIRRIISEDDKPADAGGAEVLDLQPAAEPPKPAPKPAATPAPAAAKFEPPPEIASAGDFGDDLIVEEVEPEHEPEPEPAPPQPAAVKPAYAAPEPAYTPPPAPSRALPMAANDPLVGEPAAAKAAGALGRLMGSMMVHSGVTLDDVVKEMLKPMLKEWLDANLPALVEAEVEKEIERIRRMAR